MVETTGFCIYDLALKDTLWSRLLAYPLAMLFLIDFYLTWPQHEQELRGDTATNISSGLAKIAGLIGIPLGIILRLGKR